MIHAAGFVAVAAVGFGPVSNQGGLTPKLSHTNQVQLGKVDKKGEFCPKDDAKWTVSNPGNGKANVDLGNYELQMDENNSEIKIVNKNNGEVTKIWGDPHIDWNKDGKNDADFWGKTTFQLEDGTKITIDTEKFKNNPNEYLASEVTVTRGDHAMKITGLSQNEKGDLKVEYADRGGQALDWAVTDGFVVKENANGEGWLNASTGKLATQKDFDVTKPDAPKPYEFTQEFGQALGLYLATGLMSGVFGLMGQSGWESGQSRSEQPRDNQSIATPKQPARASAEQTDANTITIRHPSGAVDTRSGGSLAWRTNNPSLLPFNQITRGLGAIGEAGGLAIFPNEDSGRAALGKLLLGLLR